MNFILPRNSEGINPDNSHTIYRNKYGFVVPSVTTILKVINKEAIVQWANSLGWRRINVKDELERTSTIGTYVHEYIESYMLGDNHKCKLIKCDIDHDVEMSNLKYQDEHEIYNSIQSFEQFWQENRDDFQIIECEHSFETNSYGGTCDVIAKYKGDLCILDLKTSKAFQFTMFLQLAAYWKAYYLEHNEFPKRIGVLKVDKKEGNAAKILWNDELPTSDIEYYAQCFDQALELYNLTSKLDADWKHIKG